MPKYDYDLIVIGGGAAGLTASTFAGQSAAKTLLIEKEKKLGGDCLHYGCVPSKSLIKSGYAYNITKNASRYGLPEMGVPPVDFAQVTKRIRGIIDTIQKHDEPGYLDKRYNVETRFGKPKFIDQHTIDLDGKTFTSRYFVLAMGSSAFIPPVEGIANVPYVTNTGIFSLEKLPASLIVLGGGPIGVEMAQAFSRLGSKVTIVQSAGQLLAREDADVAELVKQQLESEGVEIMLNTRVDKVVSAGGGVELSVNYAGYSNTISGDTLLVSAGRRANVEGLGLERAGVKYSDRGVVVDHRLRTTAKNIYACGDVNGGLLFTHVASYEAVVAVYNCILKIPKKANYTYVPWCTYMDPEVASIGINEKRAREAGITYTVQKDYFKDNDRALAEGETEGFIKILINKKGKAIGVQIVGFHAGDLIHEWVPVLNGRVSLSTLSGSIHAYPTMAEINKNSAVNYLVSTIPPWTKKITKWLFGYQGKA
jgi:pyruvate/2-oxoglutarate dehydrogenase complex dihydrolipoamide dehydrogenase (E3) component